jgi:hypothetical protein
MCFPRYFKFAILQSKFDTQITSQLKLQAIYIHHFYSAHKTLLLRLKTPSSLYEHHPVALFQHTQRLNKPLQFEVVIPAIVKKTTMTNSSTVAMNNCINGLPLKIEKSALFENVARMLHNRRTASKGIAPMTAK